MEICNGLRNERIRFKALKKFLIQFILITNNMIVNTTKNEVLDKLENKNKDIRRKLTDTDKILNKTEINNG